MKSVPGGAHFSESCPYRGTGPSEKCSSRGAICGELPGRAPRPMKSVDGGANFM